jgi:hypothetical protein
MTRKKNRKKSDKSVICTDGLWFCLCHEAKCLTFTCWKGYKKLGSIKEYKGHANKEQHAMLFHSNLSCNLRMLDSFLFAEIIEIDVNCLIQFILRSYNTTRWTLIQRIYFAISYYTLKRITHKLQWYNQWIDPGEPVVLLRLGD